MALYTLHETHKQNLIVNSCNDRIHKKDSLHYRNRAFDILRHPSLTQPMLEDAIRIWPATIIPEPTHWHIQLEERA